MWDAGKRKRESSSPPKGNRPSSARYKGKGRIQASTLASQFYEAIRHACAYTFYLHMYDRQPLLVEGHQAEVVEKKRQTERLVKLGSPLKLIDLLLHGSEVTTATLVTINLQRA